MRLAGRPEVVLDTEVQLERAGPEPGAPAGREPGGLATSVMPRTSP